MDRPIAALMADLRALALEDTLVVWGGEFGRTPCSGPGGLFLGRDYQPDAFSIWLPAAA